MTKSNLVVALSTLADVNECKKYNIKFYLNYPITTFYELQALKNLGAEYALIDSPLVQDIIRAREVGIKLRVVPNVAYYAFIPREDGVIGSWVRPDDVKLYEEYIDVFEFEDCDKRKEEALYRVYAEQQSWPSNLNNLITNLDFNANNRLILPEFGKIRTFCG